MARKAATIMLRVSAEQKEALEGAARARGLSMTQFLIEAGLKATTRGGAGAGWFKRACRTASEGGAGGYRRLGQQLAERVSKESLPRFLRLVPPRRRSDFEAGFLAGR